jgi:indolepyruvate ferredoxin oxidoreductase beta subunit
MASPYRSDERVGAAEDGGRLDPIRLYIAAMGGEGGSVLTSWLVSVATAEGWPVQSTSVPGVAQRTGATSYYLEMLPRRSDPADERQYVFALTPMPGFVDAVVATELLETGRAMEQGFVSPERTTLITSSHRTYTIHEKSAMGDERYPAERIFKAIGHLAARAIVLDLAEIARSAKTVSSSVVLGAIAGAGILPLGREQFESAIRQSGIAVEASLRGFAAGYDSAAGQASCAQPPQERRPAPAEAASLPADFPSEVQAVLRHGMARLGDYQGPAYVERYLGHVARVVRAESGCGGGAVGWPVSCEAARYLALWMSYEDVIRVAALKTDRDRWQLIDRSNPRGGADTLRVTEFLKPGVEELASLLPPRLGRGLIELARRHGGLEAFNMALRIRSTSIFGFFLLRLLANWRAWRPYSLRFRDEHAALEDWLDLVVAATAIDHGFGVEVVECARLRKGYGSTHRRTAAVFDAIMNKIVRPAIAEGTSAAAALAEVRKTALHDPEAAGTLARIEAVAAAAAPALATIEQATGTPQ